MPLSKQIRILFEQVSEKKREALYNLFLNQFNFLRSLFPWHSDPEKYINKRFDAILNVDTTPNKQYAQWLITKIAPYYVEGIEGKKNFDLEWFIEDSEHIKDLISLHFTAKQRGGFPKEYKDINKIKSIGELETVLRPYMLSFESDFDELLEKSGLNPNEYDVLYDDGSVQIYIPNTEKASCVLGAKTSWCTTYGKMSLNPNYKRYTNAFESHYEDGYLYIFRFINEDDYYQVHLYSEQIMDKKDGPVQLSYLIDKLPDGAVDVFTTTVCEEIVQNNIKKSGFEMEKVGSDYAIDFDEPRDLTWVILGDTSADITSRKSIKEYVLDEVNDTYNLKDILYYLEEKNKLVLVEQINKQQNLDLEVDEYNEIATSVDSDDILNNVIFEIYLNACIDTYKDFKLNELKEKIENFGIEKEDLSKNNIKITNGGKPKSKKIIELVRNIFYPTDNEFEFNYDSGDRFYERYNTFTSYSFFANFLNKWFDELYYN